MMFAGSELGTLAIKALLFLPIAYAMLVLLDRMLRFRTGFWQVYAALLIANVIATLIPPLLLRAQLLMPHGNDPRVMLMQMILRFAVIFLVQTATARALLTDTEGRRVSWPKAMVIGLVPVVLSAAITAYFWAIAI